MNIFRFVEVATLTPTRRNWWIFLRFYEGTAIIYMNRDGYEWRSSPDARVPSSHLGHSMWVLWWTKRGLGRFITRFLPFSPATNSFHHFLTLVSCTLFHSTLWWYVRRGRPASFLFIDLHRISSLDPSYVGHYFRIFWSVNYFRRTMHSKSPVGNVAFGKQVSSSVRQSIVTDI